MKRCPKCERFLDHTAFATSIARKRGGSYCKACQSEYCKAHYARNSLLHNRRRRTNQARYRLRNRKRLKDYLRTHACVECGEADARVLEFDHVRGKKKRNISNLVREGKAWERIVSEIAKCEVRCANCHRRRTVEQFGWPHSVGA